MNYETWVTTWPSVLIFWAFSHFKDDAPERLLKGT
jgi:hypothetical protein